MLFQWFRPKPKFGSGQLVIVSLDSIHRKIRYMLIQRRRWIKPNGRTQKQWVYDGLIFSVTEERTLSYSTTGSCFSQDILRPIPDVEYPDLGYIQS